MKRYVEGENRSQSTYFQRRWTITSLRTNPVRVVDVFVDELDLKQLGFGNRKALPFPPHDQCHPSPARLKIH